MPAIGPFRFQSFGFESYGNLTQRTAGAVEFGDAFNCTADQRLWAFGNDWSALC